MLFKTNFIFKDFSRQSCIFKYFSSLCEPFLIETSALKMLKMASTVKPALKGHSQLDKTKILMTNGSLMKVKSIADCSPWSSCNIIDLQQGIIGS